MKVPSIRTIVDSSEGPLGEKTMSKQSEDSGLALGDSDKEKQKDDRETLPSSRRQEYQQGSSPKSKRRKEGFKRYECYWGGSSWQRER